MTDKATPLATYGGAQDTGSYNSRLTPPLCASTTTQKLLQKSGVGRLTTCTAGDVTAGRNDVWARHGWDTVPSAALW